MPDHETNWNALEKSFDQRRWSSIRTSWPNFVGKPIDPPGCAPELTLSELLEGGGVMTGTPEKGKLTRVRHPRGEITEIIFREAVFWLHKALHVLGASEAHADMGLQTWSLSAAYHSAYFAARSIMAFFGVSVAEFQRVSVVVDLCRDMQGIRPQKMERIGAFEEDVALMSIGVLFDHRQVWTVFQTILRTATCDRWHEDWMRYIAHVDIADITRQRHGLHYHLKYWVAHDLHAFVYSEEFYDVQPTGTGRELFNRDSANYSLAVGGILVKMALALFKDLSTLTNRLASERRVILNAFTAERHPLFAEALNRELVETTR